MLGHGAHSIGQWALAASFVVGCSSGGSATTDASVLDSASESDASFTVTAETISSVSDADAGFQATGIDSFEEGDDAHTDVGEISDGTADSAENGIGNGWKLVWSDEFNGPNVDETLWNISDYAPKANKELEYYSARKNADPGANVFIERGALVLEGREESFQGRNYTSGKIDTKGTKAFQYGHLEARMKLPAEVGLWPAFWMVGTSEATVGWPDGGEIDMMEEKGRLPDTVSGSIHHGPGQDIFQTQDYKLPAGTFHDDWHVFATEWDASKVSWFVDGIRYFTATRGNASPASWPFDQPFFLIFDLAIGGNFDNNLAPPPGMPPQRLYVDYVRVYQKG